MLALAGHVDVERRAAVGAGLVGARRALLHMDIRPANLLTKSGALRGVVDWSNALIGDPALELARIAEYGFLTREFLAGYDDQTPFAQVPAAAELLFRLDTAVMLAVVFLSEAPEAAATAESH